MFGIYIQKKDRVIDSENDTPGDYSVKVEGIPVDEPVETVKTKFELYGTGNANIKAQVKNISPAYKCSDFIKLSKKFQIQKRKLQQILHDEVGYDNLLDPSYEVKEDELSKKYQNQLAKVKEAEEKMKNEQNRLLSGNNLNTFTGILFISFQTKRQKDLVLRYWQNEKGAGIKRVFTKTSFTKYSYTRNGRNFRKSIWVTQGPEPSDILWANLGYSPFFLFKRRLLTFTLSLVILGICFGIVAGLKVIQGQIDDSSDGEDLSSSVWFRMISACISLVITFINEILSTFLKKFSIWEKHSSITDFNRSLLVKIVLSKYLNTCILVVLVYVSLTDNDSEIWAQGNPFI